MIETTWRRLCPHVLDLWRGLSVPDNFYCLRNRSYETSATCSHTWHVCIVHLSLTIPRCPRHRRNETSATHFHAWYVTWSVCRWQFPRVQGTETTKRLCVRTFDLSLTIFIYLKNRRYQVRSCMFYLWRGLSVADISYPSKNQTNETLSAHLHARSTKWPTCRWQFLLVEETDTMRRRARIVHSMRGLSAADNTYLSNALIIAHQSWRHVTALRCAVNPLCLVKCNIRWVFDKFIKHYR